MNDKYEVLLDRYVEDLSSQAYLLQHKKSGARVFILSNQDDNKTFYIGFRTPPYDDTGVAHIMEHSVLCGSEKYPLKDPFVELVKGSLNTFLNAMTYPDKTLYPVASRNDKDFKNLMDVYLDAVLHPNIYHHPEILKQEGWSYKIEKEDDPIEYNGVVYNEMKGAFSSPEGVLEREIVHSLFPDTPYGVESGGNPDFIPDLTYDAFLDFHRKYYHPSNSYIFLYGNMDVEERLDFLDEAYLGKYEKLSVDSAIPMQKPFTERKRIQMDYAISDEEDEKDNTYLSYNVVCGDNLDAHMYYAMQMIVYALVDTQGAPIRDRLLKEGIGKDVLTSYENGILQPYFSIIVKNAEPEKADRFLTIIEEELKRAVEEGLNQESLIASLNSLEFRYKEADFGGYPKGLIYGGNALESWLYDDQKPLLHIECSKTFQFLRENLQSGYFEKLVEQYLLDNPHASLLILSPKKGLTVEKEKAVSEKLQAFKDSLSSAELKKLIDDTKALAQYQEEEDPPEALESIPLLTREDLDPSVDTYKNEALDVEGLPVIFHEYDTNGIGYFSFFFNACSLEPEDLPYLALLKSVFSFVDTEQYSYAKLNNEINTYTGGLSLDTGIYTNRKEQEHFLITADLSAKALYVNIPKTFEIIEEVLFHSKYEDTERLYEIIGELKSRLQMVLNTAGHAFALTRAMSYFSKPDLAKEWMNGTEFYWFIDSLEKNYDARKEETITRMKAVLDKLLAEDVLVSFTGDKKGLELVKEGIKKIAEKLPKEKTSFKRNYYMHITDNMLKQKNEAFKSSMQVQYLARAGRYGKGGPEFFGALQVLKTILSFDYLWFHIRVQGGAYGCMCNFTNLGIGTLATYRDPHLQRSDQVFRAIPEYIENFDVDEREMTKYVIGTMSNVDIPLTPAGKGGRDMIAYLTDAEEENLRKMKEDIIHCQKEDIIRLAPLVRNVLESGNICVVGGEKKITEDAGLFQTIRNLFES
ncbi:MAG: insulinase family protein [Lachnospiraceae bacterium]|nr:insulinase family protein [Lachnospiraceae bacterium]